MRTYNITKNLNAYGGRNKWSVSIGTTRNIKGSSNRIYEYCRRRTETPFYCMFQLPPRIPLPPLPPLPPVTKGFLSFSFQFGLTRSTPPSPNLIVAVLPIITIPGVFELSPPTIKITENTVYVEIDTFLYEQPSFSSNFGITFNKSYEPPNLPVPPGGIPLTDFYNLITDLTLISSINCPFSGIGSQFKGLTQPFNILPAVIPYFLPGTSLASCFRGCTNFNSNISGWDTLNVTDMSYMFSDADSNNEPIGNYLFNQPIGNWKTNNVTDMSYMFYFSRLFDQYIGNWDTKKVTNMKYMFSDADSFDQDIGNWDTKNVTDMSYMFFYNSRFNKPIGNWDTGNVKDMSFMFLYNEYFNQYIGDWDTSNVTTMESMFVYADNFNNGDTGNTETYPLNWVTTKVEDMNSMFNNARSFNQPIKRTVIDSITTYWDTSNVTDMNNMFSDAENFNQDIGNWIVSTNTDIDQMFKSESVATSFNNGGAPGDRSNQMEWVNVLNYRDTAPTEFSKNSPLTLWNGTDGNSPFTTEG